MKIYGKRRTYNLPGPISWTRVGLRPTSITLNLIFWRGVIWERKKKR